MSMARLAVAALLAAGPLQAQVLAVEIGRVGAIEPTAADAPSSPPTGDNLVGSSPHSPKQFTHPGSGIAARFCTMFGFEFRAPNLPAPLAMPVTVQLEHPLWKRPDGRSGTRERYPNMLRQKWSYTGYSLEESWTLVPGTWRFSILLGETVLASQSFELKVEPGQVLPASCAAPVS